MSEFTRDTLPPPSYGRRHAPVVYYATSKYGGAVKIGTTVNLALRMRNLSRGKVELRVIAVEPGDQTVERSRHVAFSPAHIGGDYFWRTEEIDAHIESLGDCSEFLSWAFANQVEVTR